LNSYSTTIQKLISLYLTAKGWLSLRSFEKKLFEPDPYNNGGGIA